MTQQASVRIPIYRGGSLPDAESLPDHLIVAKDPITDERTLLRSNGEEWIPIAGGAEISSQAEAEAGVDNTTQMTPLRVREAIIAFLGGGGGGGGSGFEDADFGDAGFDA